MPSYDYQIAKDTLSESEKDRVLAVFLNTTIDNSNTDWEKATVAYGSASVESMKVSFRNIYRKLDKAGAKNDDDNATLSKASKTRKRKDAMEAVEGANGAEKPKRGRPAKKVKAAAGTAIAAVEGSGTSGEAAEKVKEEEE